MSQRKGQKSGGSKQSDKQSEEKRPLTAVEKSQVRQDPPPTLIEWGVRLISGLLLLGLIGYVVWMAFQPSISPQFELEIDRGHIENRNGSWVVPVSVLNIGSVTAVELELTLELVDDEGNVVEAETLVFPLVGGQERVSGDYWFSEDPTPFELRFNVGGYRKP